MPSLPRRPLLLALLLLPVLALGWMLFGPRGATVTVQAKSWQFEIEVEKRVMETGSGWCDELPQEARDVERRRVDKDPSGQRAGASEHCRYSIPQWRKRWAEQATGPATTPPHWPALRLAELPADALGAERAGRRTARYLLQLRADGDQDWTCQLPLEQWQRFREGEQFRLLVDRFSTANCASVPLR